MNKEKNTQVQQKNTKPRIKRHTPMKMGLSARTGTCAGWHLGFNQEKSKRDSDFLERLTGGVRRLCIHPFLLSFTHGDVILIPIKTMT
jgi:hypothetical protein